MDRFRWRAVSLLAGLVSACSTSAAGDGGLPDGSVSVDQACNDISQAYCTKLQDCSNGFDIQTTFGSSAICQARRKLTCVENQGAPGTSATPETTEACFSSYASFTCPDFFANNPPAACVPMPGSLATGAACSTSAQCASTFCAVPKDAVCGTCQPLPTAGAPCYSIPCGRNLICLVDGGSCAAPVAQGGPCLDENACVSGLSCVGLTPGGAGTCQLGATQLGAACDPHQQTGPGCSPGMWCSRDAGCQLTGFATGGEACGFVNGVAVACSGGGLCVKPTGAIAGVCYAPVAEGAACDSLAGPPCLSPARCVAPDGGTVGTCTLPAAGLCH
jgi:hypothetical protein